MIAGANTSRTRQAAVLMPDTVASAASIAIPALEINSVHRMETSKQEVVQRVEQRKKDHERDGHGKDDGYCCYVSFLFDEERRHMQTGPRCDDRGHDQHLDVSPD